jgi:hypothetical protein
MIENQADQNKRNASTQSPSASAAIADEIHSTSREKSRVRTPGTNFQPHRLGTLGAATLVGGRVAVQVHTSVNAATGKLHADELAIFRSGLLWPAIWIIGQIKEFAGHSICRTIFID